MHTHTYAAGAQAAVSTWHMLTHTHTYIHTRAGAQAGPGESAPPVQDSEHSYDDNYEIESDEGLAGAEIIAEDEDEDEDYSAVLVSAAGTSCAHVGLARTVYLHRI